MGLYYNKKESMGTGKGKVDIVVAKSEDSHREHLHRTAFGAVQVCREFANPCTARKGRCDANKPKKIRVIRSFVIFVFQIA